MNIFIYWIVHININYLNCKLTIGRETIILSLDVSSASSQNLFISLMSPGINSFSSSAKLCDDLLSSFNFECGVSLSRQTCLKISERKVKMKKLNKYLLNQLNYFELNGVGSLEFGIWKLKSE